MVTMIGQPNLSTVLLKKGRPLFRINMTLEALKSSIKKVYVYIAKKQKKWLLFIPDVHNAKLASLVNSTCRALHGKC